MKILLVAPSYAPEINSASVLYRQLAEALAGLGHQVTVVTRMPRDYLPASGAKRLPRMYEKSISGGVKIWRIGTLRLPRRIPLLRAVDQLFAAGAFLAAALFSGRQNVVLVYSPPLPLMLTATMYHWLTRTPMVLNVQDLYPQTAIDLGLLSNRVLIRAAEGLERFGYMRARKIVVHSEQNRSYVAAKTVEPEKVHVITNWADTNEIAPASRQNSFREEHAPDAAILVSFAGVMGYAQNLRTVVKAAELIRDRRDILIILAGDGVERNQLQLDMKKLDLSNVKMIPFQSPEYYPELLAASDICLVTLTSRLKTPVVPAKMLSIMAAERPIIASVGSGSGASEIIRETGCGLLADPDEPKSLAEAICLLADDEMLRNRMGKAGREAAVAQFSLETAVENYVKVLTSTMTIASCESGLA